MKANREVSWSYPPIMGLALTLDPTVPAATRFRQSDSLRDQMTTPPPLLQSTSRRELGAAVTRIRGDTPRLKQGTVGRKGRREAPRAPWIATVPQV